MAGMAKQTLLGRLSYEVLGPVRLHVDGEERNLGGPQRRQMLALLIAARGDSVTVEQLIDGLWPDDPPATVRKMIQVIIPPPPPPPRAHLGEALTTEAGGYRLDTNGTVDAFEFEELVKTGRETSDPVAAATVLRRAITLWNGTPYADTAGLSALEHERVRLDELRMVALETLYDARMRTGALTEPTPRPRRCRRRQPAQRSTSSPADADAVPSRQRTGRARGLPVIPK